MLHMDIMKTMTIRDVRQRWPEAERSLETEREIIITRDGKPIARLLPIEEEAPARKRFDPEEHARWREETFGKGVHVDSLSSLMVERDDRSL